MRRTLLALIALASATACGENAYTVSNPTHDCAKQPNTAINGSDGRFAFTGTCERISINGGGNTVTIEAAKTVGINGAKNVVEIGAVDRISVSGSDNTTNYKAGLTGKMPNAVTASGNNNTIIEAK